VSFTRTRQNKTKSSSRDGHSSAISYPATIRIGVNVQQKKTAADKKSTAGILPETTQASKQARLKGANQSEMAMLPPDSTPF
jgi:hypothetical protein